MSATANLYRRLDPLPMGRRLFSIGYALKAPYFASIRPRVVSMGPNRAEVVVRKRRAVQNHIGTVHAIAVANGLEAAMGLLCEATVPSGMRWIPTGISLEYEKKVTGDVHCIAETDPQQWAGQPPFAVQVRCTARLADGRQVVSGTIPVRVSALR